MGCFDTRRGQQSHDERRDSISPIWGMSAPRKADRYVPGMTAGRAFTFTWLSPTTSLTEFLSTGVAKVPEGREAQAQSTRPIQTTFATRR
jgi:hypothetical protein